MSLRKVTLRYLGWCPGIEAAARFIPDKEIPDGRVKWVSAMGGAFLILLAIYSVVSSPRSYGWDIGFEDAECDDFYGMYVREVEGPFEGLYRFTMWAEAPRNASALVMEFSAVYSRFSRNHLRWIWRYAGGEFYSGAQPSQRYGTVYVEEAYMDGHHVWRIYSESRDAVFHIRVEFLNSDDQAPWRHPQ
jgi:hypothetical protein